MQLRIQRWNDDLDAVEVVGRVFVSQGRARGSTDYTRRLVRNMPRVALSGDPAGSTPPRFVTPEDGRDYLIALEAELAYSCRIDCVREPKGRPGELL
jgi:hypothetical protein